MDRIVRRVLTSLAVAAPLTLAATGVAAADTYSRQDLRVTADGIGSQYVRSATDESGGSSYRRNTAQIGPEGLSTSRTRARAGNGSSSGLVSGLTRELL